MRPEMKNAARGTRHAIQRRGGGNAAISLLLIYLLSVAFGDSALSLGNSGYILFSWAGALLLCAYGLVFVLPARIQPWAMAYAAIFLLYLSLNGLVASANAGFVSDAFIRYGGQWVLALGVFVTIASMPIDNVALKRILDAWVWIALAACVFATVQRLTGSLLLDGILYMPHSESTNYTLSMKLVSGVLASTAWFREASFFGAFIVPPTLYALYMTIYSFRLSWLFRLLVLLLGFVLSYSLTAQIALVCGAFAIALFSQYRWRLLVTLALLLVASPFFEWGLIGHRVLELVANLMDFVPGSTRYGTSTSFSARSVGWAFGMELFRSSPIFGVGAGQVPLWIDSAFVAHAAMYGIVGLVLYYALPVAVIVRLLRLRRSGGAVGTLAAILAIAVVGDLADGLITHNNFHLQRWLLLSFAFSWLAHTGAFVRQGRARPLLFTKPKRPMPGARP